MSAPLLPWWVRWVAVTGLALFIFYVSIVAVPPETVVDQTNPGDLDQFNLGIDKWRHFVAYAVFGYALAYATADWELETRSLAVAVILTVLLYGIGIEYWQSLIPERYFSAGDAYANALGALLVVPWYLLRPYVEFVPLRSWLKSIYRHL
jgi:VanZ family protein